MNQVFVAGIIADRPRLVQPETGAARLTFALNVRHRTAKGVVKQELYTVNAWNNVALWGAKQLAQGQLVALQGYLTQHTRDNGVLSVEITAEEFLPAYKAGRTTATNVKTENSKEALEEKEPEKEIQAAIPEKQDSAEAASESEAAS